jgi:hypothetical protein
VVQLAVREDESAIAEQPVIALPFDVKLTVPVGIGGPAGVTVAVNVADSPTVEGFMLEVTVVLDPSPVLTTCDTVPLLPA